MIKLIQKLTLFLTNKDYMDLTERIRIKAVMPYIHGRLLDFGCGYNNLKKHYSHEAIGIDIFNWEGKPDHVFKRTDKLPFKNKSFDTITFLACLNHIEYRKKALLEARRILKDHGRIIITMISPFVGNLIHKIEIKDEVVRGINREETKGITKKELLLLFEECDLKLFATIPFEFGLNKIYLLEKNGHKRTDN